MFNLFWDTVRFLPPYAPSMEAVLLFQSCFFGWALFEAWVNVRQWSANSSNQDRFTRFLLLGGIIASFGVARWAALFLPSFAIRANRDLVFYSGTALIVLGVLFRATAIYQLGKFFVPEVVIQPDQRVIDRGLYRYLRHPSYTGILISLIGVGLGLTNWFSLIILVVVGFGLLTYRMQVEEAALLAAFGDDYRRYMVRTKRIIPFVL